MGRLLTIVVVLLTTVVCQAQQADSTLVVMDSLAVSDARILLPDDSTSVGVKKEKIRRDWSTWRPNPKRALWLALVLPGAGQIYNRKYWKLPIFYGGFIGCIYALSWNNTMYKDYSQAYLDISDNDPSTASYNKFLHLGVEINSSNEARYRDLFRSRKEKYRRWRDMSIIAMVVVYALSVIDAYVDAELSEFDISKDLSLRVQPTAIPTHQWGTVNRPLQAQSLGVSCSLNF
jgi:hypothetical protein